MFKHQKLQCQSIDLIALHTSLWVFQQSEDIISPAIYCETQVLVNLC